MSVTRSGLQYVGGTGPYSCRGRRRDKRANQSLIAGLAYYIRRQAESPDKLRRSRLKKTAEALSASSYL